MSKVVEEMQKLRDMLDEKKIFWQDDTEEFPSDSEMWICRTHFEFEGNKISVINGFGTYGGFSIGENNKGYLEIMIGDENPIGFLQAEECMEYLEADDAYRVVEIILLGTIRACDDKNLIALLLQSYTQANGPFSNEIGDKIKKHIESLGEKTNGKQ